MEPLDILRSARQQSQRWRDLLWESVLEELEERNPVAGMAVRAVMRARATRPLYGASTDDARIAWPHLDAKARSDWIWACQFVNGLWIHTIRSVLAPSLSEGTT